MKNLFDMLTHPYPRYGLAAALVQEDCSPEAFVQKEEKEIASLLIYALESGLNEFRMITADSPQTALTLEYHPVAYEDFQIHPDWVQSSGLAAKGIYLFPSVITTDGVAKGTYDNAVQIIKDLRAGKSLLTRCTFSRSFAPTTAKINQNGKASQSEPPGVLFEAACSMIATLTPIKPAAWVGKINTAIYPDLPLDRHNDALWQFVRLFEDMCRSETFGLMQYKMPQKTTPAPAASAKTKKDAPKSEYRRPKLHSGNYPYAPRNAEAFGTVGLLGAIGRWAHSKAQIQRGNHILALLKNAPLYIVSYDAITQAQFDHHVIGLAQNDQLSDIVQALTFDTRLYSDMDSERPNWDSPSRKMFALFASRFLQSFDAPAYRDFLSTRAEYPSALYPLFKEYFMNQKVDAEIVHAARELGLWINRAAYFAVKQEVDEESKTKNMTPEQRNSKIRQQKARILVTLDGMAMGARDGNALTSSILRETGMLTQTDAPYEALPFLNAANIDEGNPGGISMETARQLLMTYMRVRYMPGTKKATPMDGADDLDAENETQDAPEA